ncbi:MAG: hypothetical protein NTU89_00440 [Candidatus Dependentiae bacterium]|nr:hypothetical protein [Candidatus Dependentiae bacterium]
MQNFIQKQIIFSVFMSIAAVASVSASEKALSAPFAMKTLPAKTQYARSADFDNTPSPLTSAQNGMSPEEPENSMVGITAPCNSPVESLSFNFNELLTALSNSPECQKGQIEDSEELIRETLTKEEQLAIKALEINEDPFVKQLLEIKKIVEKHDAAYVKAQERSEISQRKLEIAVADLLFNRN